jgi:hypothetical protein
VDRRCGGASPAHGVLGVASPGSSLAMVGLERAADGGLSST